MTRVSLQKLSAFASLALAAAFIALYVVLAVLRISYPFELEWMEGSMVDHVQRVLSGLPLYAAPSLDFVPFNYPPLYFWAAAGVAQITGISFFPLRLVSFAASLGIFLFLFLIVKHESKQWTFGLLAAGVYAATYRLTGGWFDVGRVDSLFLFFVLSAIYLVRRREAVWSWSLAGILLAAAVLTKQVALAPAAAVMVYGWIYERRLAAALTGSFVIALGGISLWQEIATGGWFGYYVFAQTAVHRLVPSSGFYFLCRGVCSAMGIAALITVIGLYLDFRSGNKRTCVFWLLALLSLMAAGALPLMKESGWQNDLMPAHVALAITLALGSYKMLAWVSKEERYTTSSLPIAAFVWIAILIQLGGLLYNPAGRLPTAADRRTGEEFLAKLRSLPGEVLLLNHGYYSHLAGKQTHANFLALMDFLHGSRKAAGQKLCAEIRAAVEHQRFSAIILDAPGDIDLVQANFAEKYGPAAAVFSDAKVFFPVTGNPTRPEVIYLARGESGTPK